MAGRFSSLGRALLIRVFILTLALTFIAIVIIAFFNFNTLKKDSIQDTTLTLSQGSIIIKEFFNHQFSHLETLALTRAIGIMDPESSKLYLERLLQENPEFDEIALVSSVGTEIVSVSRYEYISQHSPDSHAEHEHFKEALAGKRSRGDATFKAGRPIMEIAVPVKLSPVDIVGALVAEIDLRFLSEWIRQIKVGRTGVIYLVDREGSIMAHSELPLATGGIQTLHFPSVTAVLQGQEVIPYGPGSRYQNL
ncbi:MAG: cache domain-containing protein, partial [Candidatus Tectomicrobia bacterium]|nr:cache domain-containing protein [Candidatus Tectomicrobia bacterium]